MSDKHDTKYGIKELAERGEVSRRTVRYYVQRGLLPAPTGTGRGRHYQQAHLDRLIQVRTWQEQGVSLAEIEARLRPPARAPLDPAKKSQSGEAWRRHAVHPGIELHMKENTSLSQAEMEQILARIRHTLERHDDQ